MELGLRNQTKIEHSFRIAVESARPMCMSCGSINQGTTTLHFLSGDFDMSTCSYEKVQQHFSLDQQSYTKLPTSFHDIRPTLRDLRLHSAIQSLSLALYTISKQHPALLWNTLTICQYTPCFFSSS